MSRTFSAEKWYASASKTKRSKTLKALTQNELIAFLTGIRGATFATIVTETDPRLKKTGNTLGEVKKISRVNVCLGFQYTAAVNRQRVREEETPDFVVAERQWGERIPGTVLVAHKGKTYLETKVEKSLDHRYIGSGGTEIPEDMVRPFLPTRSGSGRQEVEKEILVRDYAIDSIRHVACKGEEFVIVG